MGDELIPITDEQAKAVQELAKFAGKSVDAIRSAGGFIREALGTVPQDAVGLLAGDRLRFRRTLNLIELAEKVQERLKARNAKTTPISPAIAEPLIENAAKESRPELQELWANLMANAVDENRSGRVRKQFISILAEFDPMDALVLERLEDSLNYSDQVQNFAQALRVNSDELEVSLQNLVRLGCVAHTRTTNLSDRYQATATGRQLLHAVE